MGKLFVMVFAFTPAPKTNPAETCIRTRVSSIKTCTRMAKTTPYPPCTVIRQLAELKNQDPARMLRRVTQPPHIAGPLAASPGFKNHMNL